MPAAYEIAAAMGGFNFIFCNSRKFHFGEGEISPWQCHDFIKTNRASSQTGRLFLFSLGCNGTRKAVKKTVRWTVFRPWESPLLCRCIRFGCRCKASLICHRKCKRVPCPNPIILHGHKNAFDPGLTQTGNFIEKHRADSSPPGVVI